MLSWKALGNYSWSNEVYELIEIIDVDNAKDQRFFVIAIIMPLSDGTIRWDGIKLLGYLDKINCENMLFLRFTFKLLQDPLITIIEILSFRNSTVN